MKNGNVPKKRDAVIVGALLILASVLSLVTHASFFFSIMLYFFPIAAYLSYRTPAAIKKAFLIAIPALPITWVLDYIAYTNHAWAVPSVFPFNLQNLIPFEDFLFALLFVYTMVMIREHFFESVHSINYQRLQYFWLGTIILVAIFIMVLLVWPNLLTIPYYYLWLLLIVFILPSIIGSILFPRLRNIMLIMMPFFFLGMLSWELIAQQVQQWSFPASDYIGFITIFSFHYPLEEFLVWQVFALPTALILAELGVGSEKSVLTSQVKP